MVRKRPYRLMVRTPAFSAGGGSSFGGQAMHYLYILKSISCERHYIGIAESIQYRLQKHNSGSVRSTKAYRPWKVVHTEEFRDKKSARGRELFLKKTALARKELFDSMRTALSSNG